MGTLISRREDMFPSGTVVAAYAGSRQPASGAPVGAVAASATVTAGVLTLTGLTDNTDFILYAAAPDRYLRMSTREDPTDLTRLTAITSVAYDSAGNVTVLVDGGVTTTYTYDVAGNVATETRRGQTRTFSYDAAGNLLSATVS